MALVKCPECGGMISEKAEKCPHCGAILKKDMITCPECGQEIPADSKVCPNCAYPIEKMGSQPDMQHLSNRVEDYSQYYNSSFVLKLKELIGRIRNAENDSKAYYADINIKDKTYLCRELDSDPTDNGPATIATISASRFAQSATKMKYYDKAQKGLSLVFPFYFQYADETGNGDFVLIATLLPRDFDNMKKRMESNPSYVNHNTENFLDNGDKFIISESCISYDNENDLIDELLAIMQKHYSSSDFEGFLNHLYFEEGTIEQIAKRAVDEGSPYMNTSASPRSNKRNGQAIVSIYRLLCFLVGIWGFLTFLAVVLPKPSKYDFFQKYLKHYNITSINTYERGALFDLIQEEDEIFPIWHKVYTIQHLSMKPEELMENKDAMMNAMMGDKSIMRTETLGTAYWGICFYDYNIQNLIKDLGKSPSSDSSDY